MDVTGETIYTLSLISAMEDNITLLGRTGNITLNKTTQTLGTLCHVTNPYTYIFAGTLILLAIVGTIENSLVIIAICKYKVLRTPTMVLIGALAIIDLLTSVIVIPLYSVLTLTPSELWHDTSIKLMTVVLALSLLTAVYISVDRLAHVYYLQKYNMTRKKSVAGLFISWISPFVVYSLVRGVFSWLDQSREAARVAGRITAAVLITLCIVIIVGAYVGIFILLRQHAKEMKDTLQSNYVDDQSRASKTSLLIVGAVVAMNSPTLLYTITLSSGLDTTTWFCTITLLTLLGSSALNPFIYCLRIPIMTKHALMLIRCQGNGKEREYDTRLHMISQSKLTKSRYSSMEQNMCMTGFKNTDSFKILRKKNSDLDTHEV